MEPLVEVLKDAGRLTSPQFLVALFAVGVALLYSRRTARWGRRWLVAAVLGYWFLATPVGARVASAPLEWGTTRVESVEQARGAQAVVVLGAGIVSYVADGLALDDLVVSNLRVIEGVRVCRLLGDPLLVVSGGNTQRSAPTRAEGDAFRVAAVQLGIPAARIVVEKTARTTREQALLIKALVAARHIDRFVLVTSALHMNRSLGAFRAVGLDPVPSASRLRGDTGDAFWTLKPTRQSLLISDGAIYEYSAWLYYWGQGWLSR